MYIAETRFSWLVLIWHNHQNGKCLKKYIFFFESTKQISQKKDTTKQKQTQNNICIKQEAPDFCWQQGNEITTADFGELC